MPNHHFRHETGKARMGRYGMEEETAVIGGNARQREVRPAAVPESMEQVKAQRGVQSLARDKLLEKQRLIVPVQGGRKSEHIGSVSSAQCPSADSRREMVRGRLPADSLRAAATIRAKPLPKNSSSSSTSSSRSGLHQPSPSAIRGHFSPKLSSRISSSIWVRSATGTPAPSKNLRTGVLSGISSSSSPSRFRNSTFVLRNSRLKNSLMSASAAPSPPGKEPSCPSG
ncbi:hypothetical protein DFJ74DRAFT_694881 [Hyaloraphidium curvatum]|nr:hypothetical protein DFJ74DRAFT_694881 [Hyaloraphidium curvatum]